jgi:hemerythrin-like domain-containing protein
MAESIARWHAEHVRFSRLLDLLEAQLQQFHEGGSPDLHLMRDIVLYLSEFGDRFHHPREDAAFARMVAVQPSLRLPINRLLQEHRVIAAAGKDLVARLDEIIADAMLLRATVESSVALYLTYYRHHLATEEREMVPRAARMLTADQWRAIDSATPPAADPLAGGKEGDGFGALRELIRARATS